MTAENIKKGAEGLSGVFGDITKSLKDLMEKISGSIDDLLASLISKKNVEVDNEIDKATLDLNKLMSDVKSNVEIDNKLTDKEKIILDGVLDKNNNLNMILDRTKKEFGEDLADREGALFVSMLKKETDGGKIEQSEIDEIIKEMKNNKEQIEREEKLKNIITEINESEEIEEKYTIKQIIDAYNETKTQIDSGEEKPLDKNSILENIVSFES